MTDRPIKREGMTGGNDYNTHYEGYNWGTGAKYRLNKRSSIQLDYVGNNYTSRYKYMLAAGDYQPGDYAFTKRQKFHDAELKVSSVSPPTVPLSSEWTTARTFLFVPMPM